MHRLPRIGKLSDQLRSYTIRGQEHHRSKKKICQDPLDILLWLRHPLCHSDRRVEIRLSLLQLADPHTSCPPDLTHSHQGHANPNDLLRSARWTMPPIVVMIVEDHKATTDV